VDVVTLFWRVLAGGALLMSYACTDPVSTGVPLATGEDGGGLSDIGSQFDGAADQGGLLDEGVALEMGTRPMDARPPARDASVTPPPDGAMDGIVDGAVADGCVPDCVDRVCGQNGCDGVCGECAANAECTADGLCQCVENCDEPACGDAQCEGAENAENCPADCAMPEDPCDQCGACGRMDCWLWYSPSNAAEGGGRLPDFVELFTEEQQWPRARAHTGVLLMKLISLRQMLEDDFIETHFVPKLREWNMRLAFDVSGATWASCLANRDSRFNAEAGVIQRIIDAGGRVEFLGLQSVLSKPLPDPLPGALSANCPPYSMEQRFGDVLWYLAEMKARFPGIKVGIIDASLAHGEDAADRFGRLADHLAMAGQRMDFVLLDHPYHYGEREGVTSWASVRDLEGYIRNELGIPAGLFHVSSVGGRESERRFYDETLASQDRYAEVGGHAEYHVVSSWYPHPQSELPEDAEDPRYPLTKVLLGVAERVIATNDPPAGRFGRVDEAGVVHGWAWDPDTPLVSIPVELWLDGPRGEGVPMGQFLADVARPDVNDAIEQPGDHGYVIRGADLPRDGQAHELYVYGIDSRGMGEPALIAGSPQAFTLDP